MPYHITDNHSVALCKANKRPCPFGDAMQHLSEFGMKRVLAGNPARDNEKDIALRLKSGELALDYTVTGEVFDPSIKRLAPPSRAPRKVGTPVYSREEAGIRDLFAPGVTFDRDGVKYEVVAVDKPVVGGGEPKADMFIAARDMTTGKIEPIKISYKMNSGEFGENKLNRDSAARILGEDYERVLKDAAKRLKITSRELHNERNKTFTLGYRLDIMLPKNSNPTATNSSYASVELDEDALMKIYSGSGSEKSDAYVPGYKGNVLVKDAGVAEYIVFEQNYSSAQEVIDKMTLIRDYVKQQPRVFIALKAVNYRLDKHRQGERAWDGNRPLAFAVRWHLDERNRLLGEVQTERVFPQQANFYGAELKRLLVQSNRG